MSCPIDCTVTTRRVDQHINIHKSLNGTGNYPLHLTLITDVGRDSNRFATSIKDACRGYIGSPLNKIDDGDSIALTCKCFRDALGLFRTPRQ